MVLEYPPWLAPLNWARRNCIRSRNTGEEGRLLWRSEYHSAAPPCREMRTGSVASIIGVVAPTTRRSEAHPVIAGIGPDTLAVAIVQLSQLKPYHRNPRRGDVDVIADFEPVR